MRCVLIAITLLTLCRADLAAAQISQQHSGGDSVAGPVAELREGQRVRLMTAHSKGWLVGTVQKFSSAGLELRRADTDSVVQLPMDTLVWAEVSAGEGTHGLTGAIWGGLVGGVLGVVIAGNNSEDCGTGAFEDLCELENTTKLGVGLLAGAGAGVFAGWLIGSRIKTERWEAIPIDEFRLSVSARGGAGAAVSLGLRF